VGYYSDAAGTHGFLLDQGNYTTLDVPGSGFTYATGINASGQVVGFYFDAGGIGHGFLFDHASYTTLDVPGSTSTEAYGINDSGQIVGSYSAGRAAPGFLLDNDSYTTLDVPRILPYPSNLTLAGINASGEIVGYIVGFDVDLFQTSRGFLLNQGSYTTLGVVPGAAFTEAYGINASGQIVGSYDDAVGRHGFLAAPLP
jgi:probable HAF family extracellular repeat protein